jgi:predicted transcriptional regulator
MARTTILLDDNLLVEVRQLARAKHTTATFIIHEALTSYVEGQKGAGLPSFAASGRSGKKTVARNAETILRRGLGGRQRA